MHNSVVVIFFAKTKNKEKKKKKKMWSFSAKMSVFLEQYITLTKDVVNFEQLDPDFFTRSFVGLNQ